MDDQKLSLYNFTKIELFFLKRSGSVKLVETSLSPKSHT